MLSTASILTNSIGANNMDKTLHKILEELDSSISNSIDKLEDIIEGLCSEEQDTDAFIADDVRELLEDIRGIINEDR